MAFRLSRLLGLAALGASLAAGSSRATPEVLAPGASERVVFEGRSPWNRVLVIDEGELRSLRFGETDGDTQSTVSLRDPRSVPMEYIRHAASALAFTGLRRSSLVIGLGGGTYPMLLHRSFPAMVIDVVELDPLVRRVAREYFGVTEDKRLRVHIADGASFMRRARQRWDIIFLDAYGAAGIPAALTTDTFFADVARSLSAGGLAVANIADRSAEREGGIVAGFAKAFPACVLAHTPQSNNLIAVAAASLPKNLALALQALDREGRLPFPTAGMARLFRPCRTTEPPP
jgi:spermidine synthase